MQEKNNSESYASDLSHGNKYAYSVQNLPFTGICYYRQKGRHQDAYDHSSPKQAKTEAYNLAADAFEVADCVSDNAHYM